jgi:PAS domain S-box-containing protein
MPDTRAVGQGERLFVGIFPPSERGSEGLSESSEDIYRTIFEAAPDGVVVVDDQGLVTDLNVAAERLFGYARSELLGQPIEMLVPQGDRAGHRAHRERFTAEPHPRPMGMGLELRGRRKDGGEFPVEISLSQLDTPDGRLVIATVRDMTQRNRLRDFGTGALRASEEERQRIARELHDDTAQHLATLLVQLQVLQRSEGEISWHDHLETFREELKECAEGVRRIARGLRPPELEDAGVEAALRSHLRMIQESNEVDVEIDLDPVDGLLDADGKLVLYRIVQEAVSNATRHAAAGVVKVRVAFSEDEIVAEVVDDGLGFEPKLQASREGGLGLLGMQERAAMIGGRLAIESAPGEGTRVRVRLPAEREPRRGRDGEPSEVEHV